ncbi:MAG TPA: ankyrin repeat domain-containing protein [Candidatus Thermoplasmatota archaeon]|nr:ankyrin repeat domain-containing protein [Candidatus Thermoplasmatota archaeon]
MSHAIPLPPRPDPEQYRKLAKDLHEAARAGPDAFAEQARRWARALSRLAPEAGVPDPDAHARAAWERWQALAPDAPPRPLADAQRFVAREHGFASWPRFIHHVEALARGDPDARRYEAAADAIARGDLPLLRSLLQEDPGLVERRSPREHGSTLLHYVAANGVEDHRQRTPANVVEIARALLDAGADPNAASDAYGGGSRPLMLVATSVHPERAGVQEELLDLLIERGATLTGRAGGSILQDALRNGRLRAATHLGRRGAPMELDAAAGVGRADLVAAFVAPEGTLRNGATRAQLLEGAALAARFGHEDVVQLLLDRALDPNARLPPDEATLIHHAAYGGHLDIVRLLLRRGALLHARDATHDALPVEWALQGWRDHGHDARRADVVAALVRAGSPAPERWLARGGRAVIDADPRMAAALAGRDGGSGRSARGIIESARRRRWETFQAADASAASMRLDLEEALRLARDAGARGDAIEALKAIGQLDRDQGDLQAALARYEEALALCEAERDGLLTAHTLRHVGDILHELGEHARAKPRLSQALQMYRDDPRAGPLDLANAIRSVAILHEEAGEHEEARALWGEAAALYARAGVAEGEKEASRRARSA